jgi:uncharacterized protein (TIGR01244 family)
MQVEVEHAYNYRKVDEQLVTSGLLSEQQLTALEGQGFLCVINLLPQDNEYALSAEPALIAAQSLNYFYIPVDFKAPTEQDFAAFTSAMEQCEGSKTLVHCAANYRVSAFYSLYALQKGRWTEQQADEWVSSLWQLEDYPAWQHLVSTLRQRMAFPL